MNIVDDISSDWVHVVLVPHICETIQVPLFVHFYKRVAATIRIKQKKPIVGRLSPNVAYGVRLGGMGVAMGSLVGRELAEGL